MKSIKLNINSTILTSTLTIVFMVMTIAIMLFDKTNSIYSLVPLYALLFLSSISRYKLIPLFAGAICAVLNLRLADTYAGFSLILLSGLIMLISTVFYYCSGIPVKFAYYIASHTKTRREFFKAMLLFGSLFSLFPEVGSTLTGTVFGETGNRLGISKEKTTLFANVSGALIGTMFFVSIWVVGIIDVARIGLDIVGGQAIPAFQFLTTSIQYNYFAISIAVILTLSASNMKDIGLIYKTEIRARKEMNQNDIKKNVESEVYNKGVLIQVMLPAIAFLIVFILAFISLNISIPTEASSWFEQMYLLLHTKTVELAVLIAAIASLIASIGVWFYNRKVDTVGIRTEYDYKTVVIRVLGLLLKILIAACVVSAFKNHNFYAMLADKISLDISTAFIPCIGFCFAMLIAFISGNFSSACIYLIPVAISIGWQGIQVPIYYTMATGAIFSGALAGVLISPFSVQNILTAESVNCKLSSHLMTQAEYVGLAAVISCLFGFFPLSFGLGTTFGLVAVITASYAALDTFGKQVDTASNLGR